MIIDFNTDNFIDGKHGKDLQLFKSYSQRAKNWIKQTNSQVFTTFGVDYQSIEIYDISEKSLDKVIFDTLNENNFYCSSIKSEQIETEIVRIPILQEVP